MQAHKINDFFNRIKNTVEKFQMLSPGDKVLVAVSGGPDSVALLSTLINLSPDYGLKLHIFHLNHQLRKNASRDADFVSKLGRGLGIPVTVFSENIKDYCHLNKLSIQEGAREVRYRLLEETARKIGALKIATGHNADDAAETIIMRLLKGSGLAGLTGIPPIRQDHIIRPLIETTRSDIIEFLTANGIDFVIDESNLDDKYSRNRIRMKLMPLLARENPNFINNILETCELLRDEENYLENQAVKAFDRLSDDVGGTIFFSAEELKSLGSAIGRRIIRLAVGKLTGSLRRVDFRKTQGLWEKIANKSLRSYELADGIGVCQEGEQVVIFSRVTEALKSIEIKTGETTTISANIDIELIVDNPEVFSKSRNRMVAYLDADKVSWPMTVKGFEQGDRFIPLGMRGTKKIQDFFVDEKVPRRIRGQIPIITDQKQIVWIAGYRLDDRVKVTEKTTKVAVIKMTVRE